MDDLEFPDPPLSFEAVNHNSDSGGETVIALGDLSVSLLTNQINQPQSQPVSFLEKKQEVVFEV